MSKVMIHLTIETNKGRGIKSESIVFDSFEGFGKWLAKKYPDVIKAAQPQVADLGEKLPYAGSIPNRKVTCMKCDYVNEFVLRSDIEAAQQMGGMPLCPECHAYKHLLTDNTYCCFNETCSEF